MKDSHRLIDIIVDDVKPEKIHLPWLKGDCMYPTLMAGDTITLDYNVEKSNLKDRDIIMYKNSTKYVYIHRYYKNYQKISSDNSIFFDSSDFTLIAKITHIKKDKFHFIKNFKYKTLHYVNNNIRFIEWSTGGQSADATNIILPESLDITCLKKLAEFNDILSFMQERLNSLNIRITDEKAITLEILKNELIQKAYKYITEILEKDNIPYIPFKGIDFSDRYYEHSHERTMCDIDLMVQKRDLGKIIEVLKQNNSSISVLNSLQNHHHIQIQFNEFNGLLVEFHWKYCFLDYRCDLNSNISQKIVIQNNNDFQFSNEANLCFACIHFLAGIDNILRTFLDILMILQKTELDYRKLEQTATYLNCRKRVGKVLAFVAFIRRDFQHDYKPSYASTTLRSKFRNAYLKHMISITKRPSVIKRSLLRAINTENLIEFVRYSMDRILFRMK